MIKKYSILIRPLIVLLDILIINLIVYFFSKEEHLSYTYMIYNTFSWMLISYYTKFYNVYRYTHILKLLSLIASQFLVYLLAFFAYFTIFKEGVIVNRQFIIVVAFVVVISFFKFLSFYLLKKYRLVGRNYRNVVVFGESKSAQNVVSLFRKRQDLGYRFCGFFSDKQSNSKNHLGSIKEGLKYKSDNKFDEIYCEESSVTRLQLKKIREFCVKNNIDFSLIPENKAIYSKNFILEYYGTIPILKSKQLPFERIETYFIKRTFDVFFSLTICVFFLSWILPIIWLFVKINSKDPFFFRQIRDGVNGKQFYCYKIRSMKVNKDSDKIHATKDDFRITKIGAFLRKTSLDELPQFYNVLKGEMSVIGPRPHMKIHTEKYLKEIDNYLIRNSVKPGITGLAQISGYRGEVKKKSDIENRVRLDLFYIENWSFFLDIKIIFQTIFSVFNGQEKAY